MTITNIDNMIFALCLLPLVNTALLLQQRRRLAYGLKRQQQLAMLLGKLIHLIETLDDGGEERTKR